MDSFLSGGAATAERIDDLAAELVLSLELSRGEGCDLAATQHAANRLADAFHGAVVLAETAERSAGAPFDDVYKVVESAYKQWQTVDAAFAQTIRLAYQLQVPRHNLLLDDIRASLERRAGEPIAEAYGDLRRRWSAHIDSRPWDSYLNKTPQHVDHNALENALNALARGDDLDVEDAIATISGRAHHAFVEYIEQHPDDMADLEMGLWKRPEIFVAADYWANPQRARLLNVLTQVGSDRSRAAAAQLAEFFAPNAQGAAAVVHSLDNVHESQRERFARCLMLHPDHEVRRYAANNTDINSIWKAVTPESVPCATILSLLERMVGSSRYTTAQRKIFFDAVYRRLLSLTSRSDVLYARSIVRILVKLNFFLEDNYFFKLMTVLDYLAHKEQVHGIDDGPLSHYMERIFAEKEKAGHVETEDPAFDGIPLVILRKLARDGHFWHVLVTHPIAKIARETVAHASTKERALQVANNHRANTEVLRGLGRKRELFSGLSAKLALLSNPHTPIAVSLDYLSDLTLRDVETLLRRATVHPEFRNRLRAKYDAAKR